MLIAILPPASTHPNPNAKHLRSRCNTQQNKSNLAWQRSKSFTRETLWYHKLFGITNSGGG